MPEYGFSLTLIFPYMQENTCQRKPYFGIFYAVIFEIFGYNLFRADRQPNTKEKVCIY